MSEDFSMELDAEGRAQMRRFRRWLGLRLSPGAAVVLGALYAFYSHPLLLWCAAFTGLIWLVMLVAGGDGRAELRALIGWVAREAGEAAAALLAWARLRRARLIARADTAPAYWPTPARDETHALYRQCYEELALLPARRRAETLELAEMIDGLQAYGDDPLARPPAPQALLGASWGVAAAPLRLWPIYAIGALIVLLGAQSVRVERLKDDARDMREAVEGWQARASAAEQNISNERAARIAAETRSIEEEARTMELSAERDALRQRLAVRQRSRAHEAQARADGAVVDYTERLRELAEPAAAVPDLPAAAPGGDPAG